MTGEYSIENETSRYALIPLRRPLFETRTKGASILDPNVPTETEVSSDVLHFSLFEDLLADWRIVEQESVRTLHVSIAKEAFVESSILLTKNFLVVNFFVSHF